MKIIIEEIPWRDRCAKRIKIKTQPNIRNGKSIDGYEVFSLKQLLHLLRLLFICDDYRYPKNQGYEGRSRTLRLITTLHNDKDCNVKNTLRLFDIPSTNGGKLSIRYKKVK